MPSGARFSGEKAMEAFGQGRPASRQPRAALIYPPGVDQRRRIRRRAFHPRRTNALPGRVGVLWRLIILLGDSGHWAPRAALWQASARHPMELRLPSACMPPIPKKKATPKTPQSWRSDWGCHVERIQLRLSVRTRFTAQPAKAVYRMLIIAQFTPRVNGFRAVLSQSTLAPEPSSRKTRRLWRPRD